MSGGSGGSNPLTRYVLPGVETLAGAVSEYFAPGNPIGTSAMMSGIGQLAGGAAGGNQGQAMGGGLGGLLGGLGGSAYSGGGAGGGGLLSSLGGLGGLFGGGGGASSDASAAPFTSGGGGGGFSAMQPAGSLGGLPYYSADQYANYGPNAPGNSAYYGAPASAPPPAMASPSGGGASVDPITGYLSAGGGGPVTTPINNAALQQSLNSGGSNLQGSLNSGNFAAGSPAGTDPNAQAWYSNPAYWQGAGAVGQAYLKYLTDSQKTELAKPFSSTVIPQSLNPLAGVRSSPITPPQLVV